MIENVKYKKQIFAIIVRGTYRSKKGISFFSPKFATQQFGYMKHKKGYVIKPHKHKKRLTKILKTTEVIIILKGTLRVDFFNQQEKYLFSKVIREKDIIFLMHGGHGFKVIKNVEMIEVKQGPYNASMDKIKFNEADEKKIKIKKN